MGLIFCERAKSNGYLCQRIHSNLGELYTSARMTKEIWIAVIKPPTGPSVNSYIGGDLKIFDVSFTTLTSLN